jgi:hypothetical protein
MRFEFGHIVLEKRVIDLARMQIRPKVVDSEIDNLYDQFISDAYKLRNNFADTSAFDLSLNQAAKEKRPKIIAREVRYPPFWKKQDSEIFQRPEKRKLEDVYFFTPSCIINIPKKIQEQKVDTRPELDQRFRDEIGKKFENFPEYEGIIEIPNISSRLEIKPYLYHEAVHYIIARYEVNSGRVAGQEVLESIKDNSERYIVKRVLNESFTIALTDKVLQDDKAALFESRWFYYNFKNGNLARLIGLCSAFAAGGIFGSSIVSPELLLIAPAPYFLASYGKKMLKKCTKDRILSENIKCEYQI